MDTPAEQIALIVEDFLIALVTTDIDWNAKSSPDRWSAKEVIGHLVDSASNNLHRFIRCTYEQNFKLVYAQNKWVTAQDHQHAKIEDLLSIWRMLNKQISRVLNNYSADTWQNTCDTGKDMINLVTVEDLVTDYVHHLSHHLKTITQ